MQGLENFSPRQSLKKKTNWKKLILLKATFPKIIRIVIIIAIIIIIININIITHLSQLIAFPIFWYIRPTCSFYYYILHKYPTSRFKFTIKLQHSCIFFSEKALCAWWNHDIQSK